MKPHVACDKNGTFHIFGDKPIRQGCHWFSDKGSIKIDPKYHYGISKLTYESDPVPVKVVDYDYLEWLILD